MQFEQEKEGFSEERGSQRGEEFLGVGEEHARPSTYSQSRAISKHITLAE